MSGETTRIKAITLHQPWASAIAEGLKQVETRGWGTDYRGPLAIHAGKRHTDWFNAPKAALEHWDEAGTLPLGAIVAVCELVDCQRMTPMWIQIIPPKEREWGWYEVGRVGWILRRVLALEKPIPVRGERSLWDWDCPTELLEAWNKGPAISVTVCPPKCSWYPDGEHQWTETVTFENGASSACKCGVDAMNYDLMRLP